MKTLFITCLYGNLYGTEYGGRPSRSHHYRVSLLNILKTNPTKTVCFTSEEELEMLQNFYYVQNNISKDLLEIRPFNLQNSKYFDLIQSKKNLDKMKTLDRCFEIQYNKFFWFDQIKDSYNYDRVYWIDAGLSHGGLFPGEYRDQTKGYDSHFTITLFTPEFLEKLNKETSDRINILSKNNTGGLYWSQSLPPKYFNKFENHRHIIGGMFGGTPERYNKFKELFEKLLVELLENEDELYMEELIMSCLYFNHPDMFIPREFDDWFKRENHKEEEYTYFYSMFL